MNAPSVSSTLASSRLAQWANKHESWIRTIVADVLGNRAQCPEPDIERYLQILLAEKKLSDSPHEASAELEEAEYAGSSLDAMRVDFLTIGDGVNALRRGERIDFASGVTVVFGENGSGKSGFVRVLKRAAGARTAEEILHNVRSATPQTPSATFGVTVNASSLTVDWKNENGLSPLNRASIFDSRGARLHVEEDLGYVYTPGELTLFPHIQNAIERVRATLERSINARTPGQNMFLESVDRGASIRATIESLNSTTQVKPIADYADVADNADAVIESLKSEIDTLRSTNSPSELKRARDRLSIVEDLKAAIQASLTFDSTKYSDLIGAREAAMRRREEAGSRSFADFQTPGLLTEEWRSFIYAAEHFIQKHASANYPHANSPCVYCNQPLVEKAIELIKKYRDFTSNEAQTAIDNIEGELRSVIAEVALLEADALSKHYADETTGEADVLKPIKSAIDKIASLVKSTKAFAPITWIEKELHLQGAMKIVALESTRLITLVASLQSSIEQRQEVIKTKEKDLLELQTRKVIKSLLPHIKKRISDFQWIAGATIVKNGISSILRSLTEAAKQSSDELLNRGFEKRFGEECKKLRAPIVTLNFPGRQGQVTRRKTIAAHKPSQVFSEGELKALALADFLAEVTAVSAPSTVIFDDPITSMDYRRIHEVADRIVALASEHQIIVFTHNIWFAAELLAKADKKKWKYYDIRLDGAEAGVLSSANHPRVDTIAQVSGRLKKLIESAQKEGGEIRGMLVEKGYEELRGLCEIFVEHELLKGVVQRYAPNVMMTKVEKINVDKIKDSVSTIIPIFEKACRYIASHSQPIETQGIRPTLDELKMDYDAVVIARDPHKD